MEERQKRKKISIEVIITDLKDLESCLKQIKENFCEGQECQEGKVLSAFYNGSMSFIDKTDFIEKQIDGVYYRIFKSEKK